ncbi:hypothetical protein E4U61_000347 [Claviceps capensis]|nr:hypothetical protein E4U61_000347 [Claviceps capensis]
MAPATRTTRSTEGFELGSASGAESPSQAGTRVPNSSFTVAATLTLEQVEQMELRARATQAETARLQAETARLQAEAGHMAAAADHAEGAARPLPSRQRTPLAHLVSTFPSLSAQSLENSPALPWRVLQSPTSDSDSNPRILVVFITQRRHRNMSTIQPVGLQVPLRGLGPRCPLCVVRRSGHITGLSLEADCLGLEAGCLGLGGACPQLHLLDLLEGQRGSNGEGGVGDAGPSLGGGFRSGGRTEFEALRGPGSSRGWGHCEEW